MTKTKKGLLILALIVIATVFGYRWLPSRHQKNVRINTLGEHYTPYSNMVESISITDWDEQYLSITFYEKSKFQNTPSWNPLRKFGIPLWNPVASKPSGSLNTLVKKADTWEIKLDEELKTITYETSNYRWWLEYTEWGSKSGDTEQPTDPSTTKAPQ